MIETDYVKFFRQQGRKDLWNLFVWALIEEKGWEFLRLRIVSLSRQLPVISLNIFFRFVL